MATDLAIPADRVPLNAPLTEAERQILSRLGIGIEPVPVSVFQSSI